VEVADIGGGNFTFKAKNPLGNLTITTDDPGSSAYLTEGQTTKLDAKSIAEIYNQNAIKNTVGALGFSDGKSIKVEFISEGNVRLTAVKDEDYYWKKFYDENKTTYGTYAKWEDMKAASGTDAPLKAAFNAYIGDSPKINVSVADAPEGNGDLFGVDKAPKAQAAAISMTATLEDISGGKVDFDANGTTKIKINGAEITLRKTMTVTDMINAVNSSNAGVTMSFSTLDNTFALTAKEYGTSGKVEIQGGLGVTDNGMGLLKKLGFNDTPAVTGQNLTVEINGEKIETASNSATVNGTTFTFASSAVEHEKFNVNVAKDPSSTVAAIKSFVEDYNKLISEVFAITTEKPNKDYHFITDYDIEEMELTDRMVEQWEKASKVGILYNDSTVNDIMGRLRTVMYDSVTSIGGGKFALYNIRGYDGTVAIKASSDYKKHGMLDLDEKALAEAMEINPDEIANLFTNTTDGLMKKLEDVFTLAIKSTGAFEDMGILVRKAGLAGGVSALENSIFDQIKGLNETIDRLQTRYDKQQDRYWKQFTNMEKMFAQFNSQSDYLSSMFASMGGGKK